VIFISSSRRAAFFKKKAKVKREGVEVAEDEEEN
jgi:hypothetical protein